MSGRTTSSTSSRRRSRSGSMSAVSCLPASRPACWGSSRWSSWRPRSSGSPSSSMGSCSYRSFSSSSCSASRSASSPAHWCSGSDPRPSGSSGPFPPSSPPSPPSSTRYPRSRDGCSRSPACCPRRTCSRECARSSRADAYRGTALLWSTCLAALYILLASWFFTRIHRHAVRTGLLARYSAESVN